VFPQLELEDRQERPVTFACLNNPAQNLLQRFTLSLKLPASLRRHFNREQPTQGAMLRCFGLPLSVLGFSESASTIPAFELRSQKAMFIVKSFAFFDSEAFKFI